MVISKVSFCTSMLAKLVAVLELILPLEKKHDAVQLSLDFRTQRVVGPCAEGCVMVFVTG